MSMITDELYERFKGSLEGVNGGCVRVHKADLAKTIADIYTQAGIKDACVAESDFLKDAGVVAAMKEAGIETYTDHIRLHGETAKGGISEAQAGIAELGTLVQLGDDIDTRLVAIMPEYYIGVVKGSTIVPEYDEMFCKIGAMPEIPKFVGFITGPSRTADIECVGTVGVHGPIKMTAIVVDDE